MNDYRLYEIDDLLKDDFFVEWVLVPEKKHDEFWTQWVSAHPDRSDRIDRARQILRSLKVAPAGAQLTADDLSAILAKVDEGITANNKTNGILRRGLFVTRRHWLSAAATVIVIMGLGLFFYLLKQPRTNTEIAKNKLSVIAVSDSVKIYNNSEAKKVTKLDDGSVVILEPHSGFSYTSGFNKETRDISFEGEAFFEIKHNGQKPFVIYSHGIVTKVLGTSFTIRSFAGEDAYQITVNTGKVQVGEVADNNKSGSASPIVLLANQQATYLRKELKFRETVVSKPLPLSESETKKSFTFSNTPFNDVMRTLEETYHIRIHYDEEQFSTYTITASLSALPLDEKIKLICNVVNAECSYEDGDIFIY